MCVHVMCVDVCMLVYHLTFKQRFPVCETGVSVCVMCVYMCVHVMCVDVCMLVYNPTKGSLFLRLE